MFYACFGSSRPTSQWPHDTFKKHCLAYKDNDPLVQNWYSAERIVMLKEGLDPRRTLFSVQMINQKDKEEEDREGQGGATLIIGLGPPTSRVRDIVMVFYGCIYPLVLRRKECKEEGETKGERYEVIDSAYIHGIMFAEAVGDIRRGFCRWFKELGNGILYLSTVDSPKSLTCLEDHNIKGKLKYLTNIYSTLYAYLILGSVMVRVPATLKPILTRLLVPKHSFYYT
jgi:hypothetical protein